MNINIQRTLSTRLYTAGTLSINNIATCDTVENTLSMLADGDYEIRLQNVGKKRRRTIAVRALPISGKPSVPYTLSSIEAGGSWISSKKSDTKFATIRIGDPLIPGALKKGTPHYERLFDRIEKATQRDERILLHVDSTHSEYGEPISHWLTSHHA